jgi:hypothetical protein
MVPEARVINLVLAFAWGVFGVILLVYDATTGDPRGRIQTLGNISWGWAALLLCLYNLARWWTTRAGLAARKAEWLAQVRRAHVDSPRQRTEYGEPNPDFMFGDEPPPPKT